MRKKPGNMNRRSFLETTGTVAAGFTMLPASFITDHNSVSSGSKSITVPGIEIKTLENNWWNKEPLRIVELEQGYEYSEKAELLEDLGANMEHLTRFTDTSPGTSFLDAHNLFGGKKVDLNSLDDYLKKAHSRNIKVVIYYNVHAIEISYARKYHQWQQLMEDGKPIENVYIVDSSFCINSPWREEVFQTLRKLAEYKIDGIFYDGPIFFPNSCYCEHCRKQFREAYSIDLPSKTGLSSRRDSPEWNKLLEFQSDSITRFLRDSNKIVKEANPHILLYMNGNTIAPSWPTARENRKIIKETDILGAEGGFLYGELDESVYKPGAVAKILETQADGKPTVVFDAAKQGPWAFSKLPPGEISILYSQTITHQANVWLAISINPPSFKNEMDVVRMYNRFIRENPEPFHKTESMAKIGLIWPQNAGNYYNGSSVPLTDFTKEMKTEKAGNTEEEFYGFYDGLSREHFPFDVLDEESLNNGLRKYDLLILPNSSCLKKDAVDKIRNFVRNGGNLISTFETSLYNESGKKLDRFQLNDVFGIEDSSDIFGPLKWDYLSPNEDNHFALKGINQRYINAPLFGLRIKTKAKVPLYFCKPLPGSYSGSPEVSDFPLMIQNNYNQGNSIYFAGTFGGSLFKYHFPEYYQILNNLVSGLSKTLIRLENTPSSIEVNLRKKGNSIFLYLINFTSEMRRPIQKIIPCYNLKIEVLLKEKVKRVNALWCKKEIKFTIKEDSISFELPVIEDYEVIEIQI